MDTAEEPLTPEPELADTPPSAWRGWLARLGAVLWIGVFGWALHGLHQEWSGFHPADLDSALSRIGPRHLGMAVGFMVLSYAGNSALGLLGLKWTGRPVVHPWRELAVSFISSAFSMNAGGTVLGGGSIRLRFAAAHGISAAEVGKVTVFGGLAGWSGHALACGSLFLLAPPPLDWLDAAMARWIGGLLVLVAAGMVFGRHVMKERWPAPGLALIATLVSTVDWLCAGLAMWVLLPETLPMSAWSLVAVVAVSQAVAAFTHVPGGVGVLEFTITKALAGVVAAPVLAGALVTYRLLYYLLPFFAAVVLLGWRELRLRRTALLKGGEFALRGWSMVAPRLASWLALGGGFLLLLSANSPMESARRGWLEGFVPLPFVEGSHFLSSLAGALLIVIARGLQRRIQAAWWLTVIAMASGIVFSLAKGFDWEEALVLGFLLLCLLPFRARFHRHAALWTYRFTPGWWLLLLVLAGIAAWVGFFTARHVPYQNDLWWRFTMDGDASRFLRALVGAACVFTIIAVAQVLRPTKARHRPAVDPESVEKLVRLSSQSEAALAFLGDKDITLSENGSCGLMHADQGRSRIVMGDPLGEVAGADDLLWHFVEQAQDEGMRPVFYKISVAEMPRFVDMGFKLFKLGEEARVPLGEFSLDTPDARRLRQARSRFQREGLVFEIWEEATVGERLETLRGISNAWLAGHRAGEKGFSLGFFDDAYLRRFKCAVVVNAAGEVIAFSNLWTTSDKSELSVDLMRHLPVAPGGVMEVMFIELMLWGRDKGYRFFNLGMAPLSGLSTHPLAPLWHKIAAGIFHRGGSFYNFQGLRGYKDKFGPEWEPRYIAVQGTWSLPTALLDATALIGGGLKNTVGKSKS